MARRSGAIQARTSIDLPSSNSAHLADEGWAERPASGGRIVEVSADPMEPGSASLDLIEVATAESAAADAE